MKRSEKIEVADIFRTYGSYYQEEHKLPLHKLKAVGAITSCRTSDLGGHVDECESCGHLQISYNSCRNRHCPKCQCLAKERWLLARQKDLLPISYFHIVFTIPNALNALALTNQRVMYAILFKSASETLLDLGKDKKHLGGQLGIMAILHTWGQNMMDHPHLHCVATGGGLSEDKNKWLYPKKSNEKGNDFFIHVNIISDLFKKKFLHYLKKAYGSNKLKFVGKSNFLSDIWEFTKLLRELYHKNWVTYCKKPFGSAEQVLEYLGRYTHRVAISNNRIKNVENGKVTFTWRDYHDANRIKMMRVDTVEFIRRFLLHILPAGFFKIRYYGILSNRNRQTKLKRCKEIFDVKIENDSIVPDWQELLFELFGIDIRICPNCQTGRMVRKEMSRSMIHAPP